MVVLDWSESIDYELSRVSYVRAQRTRNPDTPLNVSPTLYNTPMMNNTDTNTNTDLYATLARINAAIAAQNAEREQWVADYDRKRPIG